MTVGVVFIHGAWGFDDDRPLAADLASHLGDGYDVRFPHLPDGDDETAEQRGLQLIAAEIARSPEPIVLVGHSAGGYLLLKHLATEPSRHEAIAAICLIAVPFPSADPDWTFEGFALPGDLVDRLPSGAAVLLYASEDDQTVPFGHRDRYAAAIPGAVTAIPGAVTRTTQGGHQLNGDLHVVAEDIRRLVPV